MAEEELKRFIVRDGHLFRSFLTRYLANDIVRNAILENNERFEMMRDEQMRGTIIYCKNKPRDLLTYGLIWEAL